MAQAEAILSTVERIYDATLADDAWQSALESIVDLVRGKHAMLLAREPAHVTLAASARMDERGFARFLSPEATGWLDAATQALPAGLVAIQSHHVSDRDFERTDFYNEFVRPVGGFHGMSVCHRLPALSSFLAVCRRRHDDDFDASDQAALQSLSPHLSVALRLRQHLGVADLRTAGALAALERLNTGVMVVDAAAHLVFANDIALGLFRDGRGLGLDRDGLCAADPAATRALRRLIAASADIAASNGGGSVALPRGEARAPLRIVVAPFRPAWVGLDMPGPGKPLAIILVTDPERQRDARRELLRQRFGLTAAEADLALEIARGDGRKAAATRLDIAVTTARTHLTHIFEKTGVRRQAELVRLLMELEDGTGARFGPREC
jgi:DNA-binding CsgD family transcriptional regulator